jgi:lysozyme family protein
MPDFDRAVRFVLQEEGVKFDSSWNVVDPGYVNDPRDPGGETKFGISKRANPDLDIKGLTYEQALAIYRDRYWTPYGLDGLSDTWALFLFDSYVQHQPTFVATLRSAATLSDALWLRVKHYDDLSTFGAFGRGWVKRLLDLRGLLRWDLGASV